MIHQKKMLNFIPTINLLIHIFTILIIFSTNVMGQWSCNTYTDVYYSSGIEYEQAYEWIDVNAVAWIEPFVHEDVNGLKFYADVTGGVADINGTGGVKADHYHQEEELSITMHAYAVMEKEWEWTSGGTPLGFSFSYSIINDDPHLTYGYIYGGGETMVGKYAPTGHAEAYTWAFSAIFPPEEYPFYEDPAVQIMSAYSIDAVDYACDVVTYGTQDHYENYDSYWEEDGGYKHGYYWSYDNTYYTLEIGDNVQFDRGEGLLDVSFGVQTYYDHDLYAEAPPYMYDPIMAYINYFCSLAQLCVCYDFRPNYYYPE